MQFVDRRQMLLGTAGAGLSVLMAAGRVQAATTIASRRFTMDLTPGAIGVQADQNETIRLAAKYGFESRSQAPAWERLSPKLCFAARAHRYRHSVSTSINPACPA